MLPLSTLAKVYGVPDQDARVIKSVLICNGSTAGFNSLVILCEQSLGRLLTANDYFLLGYLTGSILVTVEYEKTLREIKTPSLN
jgi:hypothetical protein